MFPTVSVAGENAWMIRLGEDVQPDWPGRIQQLCHWLESELGDRLIDLVPSYSTVLVLIDLNTLSDQQIHTTLQAALTYWPTTQTNRNGRLHRIPACYHPSLAPDLVSLASQKQLSLEDVINIHSGTCYQVYAIGFSPGFAYLGKVPNALILPRHRQPRKEIPAGSIGIADNQTAMYPINSPAGWQIIAQAPGIKYQTAEQRAARFQVGDQVQFEPISLEEFHRIEKTGTLE